MQPHEHIGVAHEAVQAHPKSSLDVQTDMNRAEMAKGKFVSYLRVSTDKQGRSGLGLEAQREAVAAYLNGGRWTLAAEYVETESGMRADRPKLTRPRSPQRSWADPAACPSPWPAAGRRTPALGLSPARTRRNAHHLEHGLAGRRRGVEALLVKEEVNAKRMAPRCRVRRTSGTHIAWRWHG